MSGKRDRDKKELQEVMRELDAGRETLLQGAEGGEESLFFWRDKDDERIVHIRDSENNHATTPLYHFEWVKECVGGSCLLCLLGTLDLIFDPESTPPLFLICDRCEAFHLPILRGLCLWIR